MDWTDLESFSRPPPARGGDCADPEAWWGHRKNNLLRSQDELFYGYYLSAGIMMRDEGGPAVPELARRATVSSCRHDPVRAFAPVLTALPGQQIPLGDILDDSGYAHRDAGAWAHPAPQPPGRSSSRTCTRMTAAPRAPTTARSSATATCTARARPARCWNSGPLARTATKEQAADHDRKTSELARHKLGRLTADDADGYHRVAVPRRHGQDPLPAAARLDDAGPGPARDPPAPRSTPRPAAPSRPSPSRADVNAKTAQKHDYPSAAWRRSYARRTGAERGFATAKDPASNDITRGWCRLMGLAPLMLFTTTLLIVRNQRILPPGTPGSKKTHAAPPPGSPRKPATPPQAPRQPRRRHRPDPAHAAHAPPGQHQHRHDQRQAAPACPEPPTDTQKATSEHEPRHDTAAATTSTGRTPECQTQT